VGAVARIVVPSPPERALAAVQDIKGIERTEVKAHRVDVFPGGDDHGTYEVTGRFAGVPWSSRFSYRLLPTGFHSCKLDGERPRSWEISGGFVVAPLMPGECVVLHYEDYGLPGYLAPLKPLILGYLRWSMRTELRRLRDIILTAASPPVRRAR
jgi:hypothetical protein